MALSTESAVYVWQKVNNALQALSANPGAVEEFRKLKDYLSQARNVTDLQFVAFSDLTGDTIVADVACKFYGAYVKKQNTSTTAVFKMNDNATTCGGANGGSMTDAFTLEAANRSAVLIVNKGRSEANGITIASQTTPAGNTDSTAGDGPNGFIVLGKP